MIQQQSRLRRHLWLAGIAIAAALSATVSHARGSIESVTGFLQGGAEVLRIEFSEPQTELPTGFAVQTPARIALDFPGVTNASGRSLVEINQGNVKSAHIVEAGERSRIVLNLKQATTYRAELHGKAVLVLLDSVTSAARVPAGPSAVFAEGHNADVLPLKDLDFRRGSDGAGRIVVGLANNQVGVDLKTQGKGLGMRKSGTVLGIAPKDEIDERTRKDFEAAQAIAKLEPLRTQAYQLNYAKAADMVVQLTTNSSSGGGSGSSQNTRFLSERGSAIAEPRTNQLFVTDTPAKLEDVRQLLLTLDVPVRQVMIEARIVEARDTFGRSLGVRLGGGDLRANRGGDGGFNIGGGNRATWGTDYSNATNSSGFGGPVNVGGNFVNLPASLSSGQAVGSFALSIFNSAANRFLTLELSAMEADGQGKVVSSPRLITADQTKALIEQGTEYPYTVTAPNGATTIAFKKAVLKLEVVPQITPEGNIILDLDVNKDSRGESTTQGVAIDTKHIKTQVLVENGGTVVIGGIFEMEETNQENKIPVLGDVPVVGNLFKNRTKESMKREMLVFITPKVITDRGPVR